MPRSSCWRSNSLSSCPPQCPGEGVGGRNSTLVVCWAGCPVWCSTVGLILLWGRNSSLVVCWAGCRVWCNTVGVVLLWGGFFPVEGIFPLELTWFLILFPKNSFVWEYKPRSSLCTYVFRCTDSKDADIYVLHGWMAATNTYPACTIHEDGMWLPHALD